MHGSNTPSAEINIPSSRINIIFASGRHLGHDQPDRHFERNVWSSQAGFSTLPRRESMEYRQVLEIQSKKIILWTLLPDDSVFVSPFSQHWHSTNIRSDSSPGPLYRAVRLGKIENRASQIHRYRVALVRLWVFLICSSIFAVFFSDPGLARGRNPAIIQSVRRRSAKRLWFLSLLARALSQGLPLISKTFVFHWQGTVLWSYSGNIFHWTRNWS